MQSDTSRNPRSQKGQVAFLKGMSAEQSVARAYALRGASVLDTRWRGQGGEIDLILRESGVVVFCEVKAARTVDAAIASLQTRQMQRIHSAASEYIGLLPEGQLTDLRFDLAAVDAQGAVTILENAFGHF